MATFTQLEDTKPRIHRDVLFTQTPKGVLFHNAKGGFHVNAASAYRLASVLVPHLDGSVTLGELADGVGDQQKLMMTSLVGTLYERGFARDAGSDRTPAEVGLDAAVAQLFGSQVDYINHYVEDGAAKFLAFRTARIGVLGDGEAAGWAVAGLVRNGADRVQASPRVWARASVEAAMSELAQSGAQPRRGVLPDGLLTWEDLDNVDIVCVTGDLAAAQVHELSRDGVPNGKQLLPAWTIGDRLVMGPLLEPGRDGDWSSVVRALGREFPSQEAALWHRVADPSAAAATERRLEGPMAAMVGNHLAYEIFRITTGCLPGETRGGVILQDVDSLDVRAERVLGDPAQRGVQTPEPDGTAAGVLVDDDYDAQAHEGAAESDPVAEQLNARAAMVQRHCGLISDFTDSSWTQVPMKVSTAAYHRPGADPVHLAAASIDHVADARLRLLDRVAVLHAAAAVRLAGETADEPQVTGSRFLHASHPGIRTSAYSVPAADLVSGGTVLIPRDAVLPVHPESAGGFGRIPVGWGAATDRSAATARGLRDALVHAALRNPSGPAEQLHLPSLVEAAGEIGRRVAASVTFLGEAAALLGVDVELVQLSAPGHACSVVVARDRASGRHTVAGGLHVARAARDAMRDLLGAAQLRAQGWEDGELGHVPVEQFDPWALQLGTMSAQVAPADWSEAARRAQIAGCTPVAVRTTTSALVDCDVETVAVLLHRDPQ